MSTLYVLWLHVKNRWILKISHTINHNPPSLEGSFLSPVDESSESSLGRNSSTQVAAMNLTIILKIRTLRIIFHKVARSRPVGSPLKPLSGAAEGAPYLGGKGTSSGDGPEGAVGPVGPEGE
jgi:hypothetical protein